jgi:hypothetical protein
MVFYKIIIYFKMFEKVLWAFEKGWAGKKMPAGTRLGTTALNNDHTCN